jgi:sugar phosphate isomerase/epimerase
VEIAFCSIAYRHHPQMGLEQVAAMVAGHGFDALEVWGNHLQSTGVAATRAILARHGWPVPMISPYFDFTGTREAWEGSLAIAQEFVAYAQALGCPLVRAFTGHVPSAQASAAQWSACVEGLRAVCDLAQPAGLRVALETHQGQLLDSWRSVLRLLQETQRDNLVVNYQPGTFPPGEDREAIAQLGPHIAHVHYNNEAPLARRTRSGYDAAGLPNWVDIVAALARQDYDGMFSVEELPEPVERSAAIELAYLRGLLSG